MVPAQTAAIRRGIHWSARPTTSRARTLPPLGYARTIAPKCALIILVAVAIVAVSLAARGSNDEQALRATVAALQAQLAAEGDGASEQGTGVRGGAEVSGGEAASPSSAPSLPPAPTRTEPTAAPALLPTPEPTVTATPLPTPIPDTPPGTILDVGQVWRTGGTELLQKAEIGGAGALFVFHLTNRKPQQISVRFSKVNFATDNRGRTLEAASREVLLATVATPRPQSLTQVRPCQSKRVQGSASS